MLLAVILPFASLIAVAAVVIPMGLLFLELGKVGTSIVGLILIAVVPAIGFALTRGSNSESPEPEGSSH